MKAISKPDYNNSSNGEVLPNHSSLLDSPKPQIKQPQQTRGTRNSPANSPSAQLRTNSIGAAQNPRTNRGSALTSRVSASPGSSPSSRGPGRTPQTRRRELALQASAEKRSSSGSPRNVPKTSHKSTYDSTNNTVNKRPRKSDTRPYSGARGAKRTSLVNANNLPNIVTSTYGEDRNSSVTANDENEKFGKLWKVKTIEQGMVRIPTHFLEGLIRKEAIETFFDIQEKPVAR